MEPKNEVHTYLERIKYSYLKITQSRLVVKQEVDQEALEYFQKYCNDALPKDMHEKELRDSIRNMFYGDPDAFMKCIHKNLHYVLFTDARTIAAHFEINTHAHLKWENENSSYKVMVSDKKKPIRNKAKYNNKKDSRYNELVDRVDKLTKLVSKGFLQKDEPQAIEPLVDNTEEVSSGKWGDRVSDD